MWLACTLAMCTPKTGAHTPVRQRGPVWWPRFMWKVSFPPHGKSTNAPSLLCFLIAQCQFLFLVGKYCPFCSVHPVFSFMFAAAKPITIVQGLEDAETFNGGEALFECALSRPESRNCRWLLDGKPVKESPSAEIVTFESGRRHLLLLKELSLKDSCTVTFEAGTASTSAKLSVKGE